MLLHNEGPMRKAQCACDLAVWAKFHKDLQSTMDLLSTIIRWRSPGNFLISYNVCNQTRDEMNPPTGKPSKD